MRDAGVSVDPLVDYVALFQQGDKTKEARKMILVEQRDSLVNRAAELQKLIARLDYKIEHYFDTIAQAKQSLSNREKLEPCE
jgi:DNA-binding transcriptional MerR regulator